MGGSAGAQAISVERDDEGDGDERADGAEADGGAED